MATTPVSQDFRLYASAEVWEQEMQPGQRNLLRALVDFWPRGVGNAVDVGCGDGKLTQRLANAVGIPIVGFDSSAEALSRVSLPKVQGDAANMPFGNASYDLVLSTDTLEHVPAEIHDRVWSEIFRVARRHVMVAVPFREELLDATALCPDCGKTYHVNWHQRSYDMTDLRRQAPPGWQVCAMVISGQTWPETLPAETHVRRFGLGQWSGWSMALCPHCGAPSQEPCPPPPLQPLLATALGEEIYASLQDFRVWRSHSEILCLYGRNSDYAPPSLPRPVICTRPASLAEPGVQELHQNLVSYPQVARCVSSVDGGGLVQFPLYEATACLHVQCAQELVEPLDITLEDGLGVLYSGRMMEAGQSAATIALPRPPLPGQYGVLLRLSLPAILSSVQLGVAPSVLWASPDAGQNVAYLHIEDADVPLWVQVTGPTWLAEEFWRSGVPAPIPGLPSLLSAMEKVSSQRIDLILSQMQKARNALESAQVTQQNLQAERDALLLLAHEADRLAVEVQNLQAEREALLSRARDADRLAVTVQNLQAEGEVLRQRCLAADLLTRQLEDMRTARDAANARAESAYISSAEMRQTLDELRARPEYRIGEALRRRLGKEDPEAARKKT